MNKRDEALERAQSALADAEHSSGPEQITAMLQGLQAMIEAITLSEIDALKEVAARLMQGSAH